jgi:hypothetical protein
MASSSHLKPGDIGEIFAEMYVPEGWKGPITKRIKVLSNDPSRSSVLLILYAIIR